ncbi:MAG: helix-hairpin-helix domain-containing protein [Vicinamibacterales bacterium]|nr:helix-hairpin-helix domain-containing protein [Vicinamibacterales bacterium]
MPSTLAGWYFLGWLLYAVERAGDNSCKASQLAFEVFTSEGDDWPWRRYGARLISRSRDRFTLRKIQENPASSGDYRGGEPATPAFVKLNTPSSSVVNINTASHETLQTVPGIGAVFARRIIWRRPFQRVDQLTLFETALEARLPQVRGMHPAVALALQRFARTTDV